MKLQYTAAPTLDLSSIGLGTIVQNAIFDISRLKYPTLAGFTSLSNFTDLTTYPATPSPFVASSSITGLAANRPNAGLAGREYFATDANGGTGQLYRDSGTVWVAVGAGTSILEAQLDPATDNALNASRMAKYTYDFAVQGGADSALNLTGTNLPAKAVVVAGFMEVLTALAGASGTTASIQLVGAGDIVVDAAVSGAPWSTTGRKAIVPLWSDMTKAVKVVTASVPQLLPTTHVLSNGKFNLFLVYFITD